MHDVKYLYKRVLKTISDPEYVILLRKLRCKDEWGANLEHVSIIDPRSPIGPTVIHETLHYLYPKWPEKKTVKYEYKIVNSLTVKQHKNLLQRILWKMEERL